MKIRMETTGTDQNRIMLKLYDVNEYFNCVTIFEMGEIYLKFIDAM